MRGALCLLLIAVAASCNSESSTTPLTTEETAAVGTYSLVLVGTSDLPANFGTTSALCIRTVESGTMELGTNHRFVVDLQMRAACANPVTGTAEGTGSWAVTNGALTLSFQGGTNMHPGNVSLNGKVITYSAQFNWQGETPTASLRFTR